MKASEIFFDNWDQLTADQASMLLTGQSELATLRQNGNHEAAGMHIFRLAAVICKNHKVFKKLSSEQILDIFQDLNLFEKTWYHFHITWIKGKNFTLRPPMPKLQDLVFEQLVDADTHYSAFLVDVQKDEALAIQSLDKLIAVLYRDTAANGQKQLYNARRAMVRATELPAALDFQYKYLVLRTYANCRSYIMQAHPYLFPSTVKAEGEEPSLPAYLAGMWHDLLCDLSETDAFKGMAAAKSAPINEALYYLEKKAKENWELKRKSKQKG